MKSVIYRSVDPISRVFIFVLAARFLRRIFFAISNYLGEIILRHDERVIVSRLSPLISIDNIVIQGVFKGQKFFKDTSVGSSFLPKILGTYEIELEPVWEAIKHRDFEVILDIGCAEGFYACGLAKMFPNSSLYAFDTDLKAQSYCAENAKVNGLSNVLVKSECTPKLIAESCYNKSAFILCDIEGAEKELFSAVEKSFLTKTFILIELHDGVDPTISNYIKARFSDSHHIESFFSTDDIHRPRVWSSYNMPQLSPQDLYLAMREKRGHIMEWVLLSPK